MESSRPVRLGVQIPMKDRDALRAAFSLPPHVPNKRRSLVRWAFPRSRRSGRDGWSTRLFKWAMGRNGKYEKYAANLLQRLLIRWFATRIVDDVIRADPRGFFVLVLNVLLINSYLISKPQRVNRRNLQACIKLAIRASDK